MKVAITLPIVDRVSIVEVVIRSAEIGLLAEAYCGGAVMAKVALVVRDGETKGVKHNQRPTSIQGALSETGHRTPTGYRDLLKAIGDAAIGGKDIHMTAEKCGKAAGWFLS